MDRYFDPNARICEKQAARDECDADLAAGRVNASELQARNSFVAGLDVRGALLEIRKPLR